MSEKFGVPKFENPADNQSDEVTLEGLFSSLPTNLQEEWEKRLSGMSIKEQIAKLQHVLEQRSERERKIETDFMLLPEGIELYRSFPADMKDVVETLRQSDKKIEIGYGNAGHVVTSPNGGNVCYKILFDKEVLPDGTNQISREATLQSKMAETLDGKFGVRVPKIYAFIREPGTSAISMELLNAPSLRRVIEREKEAMPENFDIENFFEALRQFVEAMHDMNFYHRDLHAGNVLVHRETGMPCVIDFGLSTDVGFDEKEAYRQKYIKGGQTKELVLQSDKDHLDSLYTKVSEYVRKKKEL